MKILTYKNTPIYIGTQFSSLTTYLPKDVSKVVFLVDENVYSQSGCDFGDFQYIIIPAGESSKSMMWVEKILEHLVALGLDRSGFLVGIGGGVVCDITGFVASIFMRGVRFGFVPTTLLAQIDASIGGKNGVNLGDYKNMVGTFTQPEFILVDLQFLQTLPQQELISGMAEAVKHACIQDLAYFEFIEQNLDAILAKDSKALNNLILHSIRIKTEIVEADERESGLRKLLNFGHTFGHAIEKKYKIAHGEAISLGILLVNQIAVHDEHLEQVQANRVHQLLSRIGLPTDLSFIDFIALQDAVLKDKKRNGSALDLILLHEIGVAQVVSKSVEEIQELIESMT